MLCAFGLSLHNAATMESRSIATENGADTADYPWRLSRDSIIRFECLTRPEKRTDLDLPAEYKDFHGALLQPFAPPDAPCYTLKDKTTH